VPYVPADVATEDSVTFHEQSFDNTPDDEIPDYFHSHTLPVVNANVNARVIGNIVIVFDDN
jgi:hypothetical protein